VRVSDRQLNVEVTSNAIRDGRYELHNATMVARSHCPRRSTVSSV
jgi:hypothetical protein